MKLILRKAKSKKSSLWVSVHDLKSSANVKCSSGEIIGCNMFKLTNTKDLRILERSTLR